MGEFLLSILGFNEDGEVIYTRLIRNAKYEVGQLVPIYYPHKSTAKGKSKPYYRIFGKAIRPDLLHDLLETKNPDAFDGLGYTKYQRELQDAEIHKLVSSGVDIHRVAKQYKWMPQAIIAAIHRHNVRVNQRKQAQHTVSPQQVQDMWDNWESQANNATQ